METSTEIKVPISDIYKICVLDSNGAVKRIIVFSGTTKEITNEDEIFSEEERLQLRIDQPELINSKQQIHKDDSIRIIKKKIIYELGVNNISYDELYLFSKKRDKLHLLKAFLEMTNQGTIDLTKNMVGQFLYNILSETDMSKAEEISKIKSEVFTYDMFTQIFNKEEELFDIFFPLGRKFSSSRDLLFSANPFTILHTTEPVYQQMASNKLITYDNHLLLNYGEITNNTIYLSFAGDVLNYAISNLIAEDYISHLYFPLLKEKDISTKAELLEAKEDLIRETQDIMKEKTMKIYDVIDLYYNAYYSKTNEIPYLERGIQSFEIIQRPEFTTIMPLDILFKQFHVNKEIPYIKYNPGSRRDPIYRLYSTKRTKNGKKIPYLPKNRILSLTKEYSKGHRLHLYIQKELNGVAINIFLDLDYNGNVSVRSEFNKPIDMDVFYSLFEAIINPILKSMNKLLETNGYQISLFDNIATNEFIDIIKLNYAYLLDYKSEIKTQEYLDFLSSAFEIIQRNIDKGAILKFKRVENYRKMDAMGSMITNLFKKTDSEKDIIDELKVNFGLTDEDALLKLRDYLDSHIRIGGKFVNKSVDIAENPGFPVIIRTIPFENKLSIQIQEMNSIQFIDVLHVYIDSFLRITQYPGTTTITKQQILAMSTDIKKTVDISHVNNVILSDIQPFQFKPANEEDEEEEDGILFDEEEEEEEEDDGGILFEEDDEEGGDDQVGPVAESLEQPDDSPMLFQEEDTPTSSQEDEEINFEFAEHKRTFGGASNIFFKRLKEREPALFLTKKEGNFGAYSGACATNVSRQPVILTEEEKRDIDENYPGSYEVALPYSTKEDKKFWYICPRYWCIKKNRPMTEEQFKRGDCNGITTVDKENVYEFTDEKEHKDKKGNYRQHRPGFLEKDKHPNPNFCLPCCFKNMNADYQIRRRGECSINDTDLSTGRDYNEKLIKKLVTPSALVLQKIRDYLKKIEKLNKEQIDAKLIEHEGREFEFLEELEVTHAATIAIMQQEESIRGKVKKTRETPLLETKLKNTSHILGFDKFPINQYRWGFLPLPIELFLNTNNSTSVTKKNPAILKENESPILRYGVEQSRHQSFLGCIADIYAHVNADFVPTIENMRNEIVKKLNIDIFLKTNNGSLVSVFKKAAVKNMVISDIHVEKYRDSVFYKSFTNLETPAQNRFLKETILSYENFLDYLRDPDSFIDYTYLWDLISMKESVLFKDGINLVIMEIVDNDVTNNVELICPTNSYSDDLFSSKKGTILLVKREEFFEPIYIYGNTNVEETNTRTRAIKIFQKNNTPAKLIEIFDLIRRSTNKQCKPLQSIKQYKRDNGKIELYEFKENIPASATYQHLLHYHFIVKSQIINYRGKIIGLIVGITEEDVNQVYVPTLPSSVINGIEIKYIDTVVWQTYETTVKKLAGIQGNTNGSVRCKPTLRLVEDGLIVGLLTETNQFVQVAEPYEVNDIKYDSNFIEVVSYKQTTGQQDGYYNIDKQLALEESHDMVRVQAVRNITLETQFYMAFRIKIRALLNDYANHETKKKIVDIIENVSASYTYKLKKVIELLTKQFMKMNFTFAEITEEALNKLNDMNNFTNYIDIKLLCFTQNGSLCIPSKNLIDPTKSNKVLYFTRLADELLRYNRVRKFLLEPKRYLNITNVDYSIRKDEILILQSILLGNYFDDLIPFTMNKYIQNINYDTANPSVSTERFQNRIPLAQQGVLTQRTTNLSEFDECIEKTMLITDDANSIRNWKEIFQENTKEIVLDNSPLCSFYVILFILKNHANIEESVESIKLKLWKIYEKYFNTFAPHFYSILSIEGKLGMISAIKKKGGKISDFETMIMNDSYFLTNLDLWLLAISLRLPIVLFSSNKIENLTYQYDWFVLNGDVSSDRFYFVRCLGKRGSDTPEKYHLIEAPFQMNQLRNIEQLTGDPDYLKHMTSFEEYMKTYPIKI